MNRSEFIPDSVFEDNQPKSKFWTRILIVVLSLVAITAFVVGYFIISLNQPPNKQINTTVTVNSGDSIPVITSKLEAAGVIKSEGLLYLILVTKFDPTQIKASTYVFSEPLTTYEVANRLMGGDFDSNLQPLTIIEGESRKKIAARLIDEFTWFDQAEFMALTDGLEGYLFPDTYFVPSSYTTAELVSLLSDTNANILKEYETAFTESDLSVAEIITLASIIEREANSPESMKNVASVLLNRLAIGMALQADATIEYVLDEDLGDLPAGQLAENLRELDSPYNTYRYSGLPPTPISNPGRAAIEAVLYPAETEYLYYITGNDGDFYYANTYDGHLLNIDRYLR
jgi:UPF0755 protein